MQCGLWVGWSQAASLLDKRRRGQRQTRFGNTVFGVLVFFPTLFCSDLVLFVGDVLRGGATRASYVVEDMLGCGTFGQVVRCRRSVEGLPEDLVAVKGMSFCRDEISKS